MPGFRYQKADSNSVDLVGPLVGGIERQVTRRFGDTVEVNDQFFIAG